jgi:deoxyribodipyrimidine photo-lyase
MISENRIKKLNENKVRDGKFVLYWMQASQRAEYNHALEYSIEKSNKFNRPLLAYFGITNSYPEANERHYYFMIEGLKEVQEALEIRGIKLVIKQNSPEIGACELAKFASLIIVDQAYTKTEKKWTKFVAERVKCPFIQVESNVIVPVNKISLKEEYSAATFRPKIRKLLNQYPLPIQKNHLRKNSLQINLSSLNIKNLKKVISRLKIDKRVNKVENLYGGTSEAKRYLNNFIKKKLDNYPEFKNDPTKHFYSNMSPYLHFGQISPLFIALKILESDSLGKEAYLEELIIRRELAFNFVFYNKDYNSFNGLPNWAKRTLNEHKKDPRKYNYNLKQLETAETHDPYWNAAQKEMILKGKMHGYMRMYWGKKIIEWTKTPQEAYRIALYLNNKYEIDGRDPNGFAGVAWCFGKHDRAWKERPIFGKIRYMNANGLQRKFDIETYVKMISNLST